MSLARRTLTLLAGVATVGAAIGALIAAAGIVVASVATYGAAWPLPIDGEFFRAALLVGAALGAALGAATTFGPLRRAPLGRLLVWTSLGTALGLGSGFLIAGTAAPILLALVGFFAGALHVERREWLAGRLPLRRELSGDSQRYLSE